MKNIITLISVALLLLIMCKPINKENNNGSDDKNIPHQVIDTPALKDTIFLNLDTRILARHKWQLAHAELKDSLKPFVILSRINARITNDSLELINMKFRAEPFLGNRNFYKVIGVEKRDEVIMPDGNKMYNIDIKVDLRKNPPINNYVDALKDVMIDKNSAFDYHVKITAELEQFILSNTTLKFEKSLFFSDYPATNEGKICCGAICASRFIY